MLALWRVLLLVVGAMPESVADGPPVNSAIRSLSISSRRTCYNVQLRICPGDCWEENGEAHCEDTVGNCDVTGWHCTDEQSSVYCTCQQFGDDFVCEGSDPELCEHGSPPCLYGRCKSSNEACGKAWSLDPTSQTCETLFGVEDPLTKQKCELVFGNKSAPVCPASALSPNFGSWANIMNDADKVVDRLRAAALDTIFFYDHLRGLVLGDVPAQLVTSDISVHFELFRQFSCLRNLPECIQDRPQTGPCESSCDQVTDALHTWLARCWDVARSTQAIHCTGFGEVRDCDGTLAAADSSDLPGLCETFQNEPMLQPQAMLDGAHRVQLVWWSCVLLVLTL